MEIVILVIVALVVAMYFAEELQLTRAARMADRRLDRLENEQIKDDVDYYSSAKNIISAEQLTVAKANKEAMRQFRDL